jgi:hypothetical protein
MTTQKRARRGHGLLTIASAIVAMVLAPASVGAIHVTREAIAVAVGAGAQFDPSLKGDLISYTDIAASDPDIVVYRISDGTNIRIADSGGAQEQADVDGDYVVFEQWNAGDTEPEIFVYRISATSYTQITDNNDQEHNPAISGTRIVWTDSTTSTVWIANVDGSGMRALAPGGFQSQPAFDGDLVAWVENGNIVSYNLTTSLKTLIAAGNDPDVSGSKIVWASGGDIWLMDGAVGPVNLTSDAASQRKPKVSATLVSWEEVVSASDVDIVAWDFRSGSRETLAGGAGIQDLHDLDGTSVAYTERSPDAFGDIWLIRELELETVAADLDLDPSTINLKSKGNYLTGRLEFQAGRDPASVDLATVTLRVIDPVTSAVLHVAAGAPTAVGDADRDGIPDLTIKFDRATVQSWFSSGADPAIFRVEGRFGDGTAFEGEASARIISAGVVHTDNGDPASVQY